MFYTKLLSTFLAALLVLSPLSVSSAAVPQTVQDKLAAIEADAYGGPQSGALIDRINHLEADFNGSHMKGSMMARVDAIYDQLYNNAAGPSFLARTNAIEWNISHEVSMKSIQERITDLELVMEGKTIEGTFGDRLANLSTLSFGNAEIPMTATTVPANSLIKIALVTPVNAKNLKVGDTIHYKVAEDVIVDGSLVFAKGEPGEGTVTKVKQARNFGRDAEVNVEFEKTKSIDGTYVTTYVGEEAKEEMEHMAMAAGASLAGIIILGPIGIIAGAFVHGKNVDLPEGTEAYIQTKNDEILYGVQTAMAE